jgi:hypothetical protein
MLEIVMARSANKNPIKRFLSLLGPGLTTGAAFAAMLYKIGLVGAGFLVIPILAGSSAYAFAETFAWKEGLDVPVTSARNFYASSVFRRYSVSRWSS